jgi:hypothetical protein
MLIMIIIHDEETGNANWTQSIINPIVALFQLIQVNSLFQPFFDIFVYRRVFLLQSGSISASSDSNSMSVSEINGDLAWVLPDGTYYFAGGDNSNCTVSVCPVELSVYGYRPSLAASGTLIGLYAICLGIQTILGFRYKAWWFMSCMIAGCIDEILGYAGRIMYWQNPWGQTGFILQIVTITIGPVFFAGAIYVLLSQM